MWWPVSKRGSAIIERYLDPSDTSLPDLANSSSFMIPITVLTVITVTG